MKFNLSLLVLALFVFCGCRKEKILPEPEPLVAEVSGDGIQLAVDNEIVPTEMEFSDTSRIALSPGFEQLLIQRRIDPDTKSGGYILYKYIKDIDTLKINDYLRVEDKTLRGIEGFTNLRYFSTVSLEVSEIDFSNNKKLEYFEFTKYPHCMGCGTLTSLTFGENSVYGSSI